MPPQTITHYEVLGMIGKGGMGSVYKARDVNLERLVALKFLNPELTGSAQARARLLQEGRTLSSLSHPNIATMFGVEEVDEQLFLALEFLPGGTLRSQIRSAADAGKRLDFRQVADWGGDIAAGLAYAHRHGVVHRDVKSNNIMFDGEGRLKITDFGLAKTTATLHPDEPASAIGTAVGTLTHMAPEVIAGHPATPKSDLYALGVVLFELATGQLPFTGQSAPEVLHKTCHQKPVAPSALRQDLPVAFDRLVLKLLEKQPGGRPKDAGGVARELKALVPVTMSDKSTETVEVSVRSGIRRRLPLAAVLAVSLLLLAAAAAGWKDVARWVANSRLPRQKQVVVLPFRNIGGDAGQQAFCDGLTETVTTALSKHGEFSVVPASETRGLTSAEQARKEFGANLVIYGIVQQRGESVRLIISLIDAERRRQIDAQPVEWPASRLYELEDGAMVKIGDLLNLVTAPEPSLLTAGATQLPAAYGAYLRGRGYLYRYDKPGNLERAEHEFQEAVALDRNFAAAQAALAEMHLRAYRLKQETPRLTAALAAAEKAKQMNGSLASARTVLGGVLTDMGRQPEAVAELEEALRLDPRDAGVYRELGRLYGRMGRHQEAERTYRRGLAERPFDWFMPTYAASYFVGRQRLDEAEKLYRKAIELSPDNYAPHRNLGTILIKAKKNREGERELLEAQALNPTSVGFANLAALYMMEKRYREAVPMARRAAENAGRDAPNEYRIWGNLGDAYWLAGEQKQKADDAWTKAAELAQAQLARTPNDMRVLAILAKFEAKLGRTGQAVRDVSDAVQRDPDNADVRYQAALTYSLAKRIDNALQEVGKAVELRYPLEELRTAPELAPLTDDPRFRKLVSNSGKR